jgi:hypothetical protein
LHAIIIPKIQAKIQDPLVFNHITLEKARSIAWKAKNQLKETGTGHEEERLKELAVRELDFGDWSRVAPDRKLLPRRSDNCARILVYKLSKSGKNTFPIYHRTEVF